MFKRRGRKPSKKTLKAQIRLKTQRKWLDCSCGRDGAWVDGDIDSLTCSYCVQEQVAPPPPAKKALTPEEKVLKIERKKAREAKKAAIARGEVPPPTPKDLGFCRGWHRKQLFEITLENKTRYFSFGKEVTKAEFAKIRKSRVQKDEAKKKATSGWGRGWHLKKSFKAPDGTVYCFGKPSKKGGKKVVTKKAPSRKVKKVVRRRPKKQTKKGRK